MHELAQTRTQLVHLRALINQAVKLSNATGKFSPGLPVLAGRLSVSIDKLDALADKTNRSRSY